MKTLNLPTVYFSNTLGISMETLPEWALAQSKGVLAENQYSETTGTIKTDWDEKEYKVTYTDRDGFEYVTRYSLGKHILINSRIRPANNKADKSVTDWENAQTRHFQTLSMAA